MAARSGKVRAMRPSREELHVRTLQLDDHGQIRDLAAELTTRMPAWRSPEGQRAAVESWIDPALAAAEDEGHAVFVAAASTPDAPSDVVLGFVSTAERTHFTGERERYIGELVVVPRARRQGIAAVLIAAAEDWVRRRGLTRISLETGAENTAARAAYASLGYLEEQVTLTKTLG